MDIGKVQPREITEEMQESYLDYAMSVIISRALPDLRDGFKPVHRRILYAMHDMGLAHAAKFRKSAAVVGDVIAKYHPHGDIAVYDSLVRMVQDFSLRYPLIEGQGNFGSIDGDNAAAYRYTEARLSSISEELLKDIDKDTVDWQDNYDKSRKEPIVLPSSLPQLLLNGTMGIAVGMATNIPPHNIAEVIDATIFLIDNPKATTEDLFQFVKGPDFPTGGFIYNKKEIIEAYSQGRGSFICRGRAEIIENAKSKKTPFQIIIYEIPYQVNKAVLIEKMADLVRDKKVDGVRDIRDESDKEGLRVVVELRSDAHPQKILNKFYKFTDLQKAFHLNMLALVDGIQPQVLSLSDILSGWISHRKEVVKRRTQFDLKRAEERAHILEGLKGALSKIDQIIKTIKSSETREIAHEKLRKKFKFSAIQATAILEMKLQALAGLERKKIEEELKEKKALIKELTLILKSPKRILGVIKKELKELKEKYGDERRTKVLSQKLGEFSEADLIPQEEVIITLTRGGYIKRVSPQVYRVQKRGGKGIIGMATKGEDLVEHFLSAFTHDDLLFFSTKGKVFKSPAYEIPEAARVSRGRALVNFLELEPDEKVSALIPIKKDDGVNYLVMATRNGIIKKTKLEDFGTVRRSGLIAIKLKKGDSLRWVDTASGKDEIMLISKEGRAIRFKEKDIRPMGRAATGVRGMKLKTEDKIVSMGIIRNFKSVGEAKPYLLVVSENGFGKKTDLNSFKQQKRDGSGIKTAKINPKTGSLISAKIVFDEEELIAISQKGQVIRTQLKDIPRQGRATQGVRVMRLEEGDRLASIACL